VFSVKYKVDFYIPEYDILHSHRRYLKFFLTFVILSSFFVLLFNVLMENVQWGVEIFLNGGKTQVWKAVPMNCLNILREELTEITRTSQNSTQFLPSLTFVFFKL
jgi:hypothetical protein